MLRNREITRAAVVVAVALLWASPAAADVSAIGAACPGGAQSAQATFGGNNVICVGGVWQYPAYQFGGTTAVCNSTNEGMTRYNSTSNLLEFCNGSAWTAIEPVQSTPVETAPSGSGYFVLSGSSYVAGNYGSSSALDGACLTDLTTNTGWQGYSTANSNGQLIAAKVHASLCDGAACTNLMPLTKYYFANAGNSSAGGAYFTTDSGGDGPGDSADWAAANYFSGIYVYWTGRDSSSSTAWSTGTSDGRGNSNCYGWSYNGTSGSGIVGNSGYTDSNRWGNSMPTCDGSYHLICFVNP